MRFRHLVILWFVLPFCVGLGSYPGGGGCGSVGGGLIMIPSDPYQGPPPPEPPAPQTGCQPTFCPIDGGTHGEGGDESFDGTPIDPNDSSLCHPLGWDLQYRREDTLPKDPAHILYRRPDYTYDYDPDQPEMLVSCGCDHPDYFRWLDDRYDTLVPFWKDYAPLPALSKKSLALLAVLIGLGGAVSMRRLGL